MNRGVTQRLQVRSLRQVNDRVNEMASMGALVEMSLAALMVLFESFGAALGCAAVLVLFAAATSLSRSERRNVILELRRDVLSARVLGEPVFAIAVAEIDSAMQVGPRTAVLRAGSQKVVLELEPESAPAELEALIARLPCGQRGRDASRITIAILGQAPRRIVSLVALLWLVGFFLSRLVRPSPGGTAALAASLGILLVGQMLALALVVADRKRTSLVLGERDVTVRRGEVHEVFPFARVRAIELDDGRLFPSITVALVDGHATRVTPVAREETAAVASELARRFARSQRLGPERPPTVLATRRDGVQPSDPPADADVLPLEPRGALAFLGGTASLSLGADGLLVRRGTTTKFFAFADLRAVSVTPFSEGTRGSRAEIVVHGDDGRSHLVGTSLEPLDAGSLSLHLAQAIRAHHGEPPAGAERLARGGRSIARWRAELAAARGPTAPALAFRSSTLEDEHLRDILASPRATLEERVGAALALRETSPELRARIRIEASATADPRLRVALEAVAEDELDERRLEAALRGEGGLRS